MIGKQLLNPVRATIRRHRDWRRLEQQASGIRIHPTVDIRSPHRLVLARDITIDAGAVLHCGGMAWSPPDGRIQIGAGTYIGPNSVLFGAAGIEIGDAALVSPGVVITSHQHSFRRRDVDIRNQPLKFGRVVIERDVWIGANATILPGIRLGEGSVVGAGAVVTRDIPAWTVALGAPARVSHDR